MYFKKNDAVKLIVPAMLLVNTSAFAAIPDGYYSTVDTSDSQTLRNSLHEIIDDHQRFPYTSSSTDTWDILEAADQDPDNANNVIDVYKNASYSKAGGGNSFYNREHSWPKSYGFPKDGSTNYPYTDTHHLFIADSSYNSSRNNKPYGTCDTSCSEKVTLVNNNRGGSSSESNWTTGSGETGSWQTWQGRRGDVARALMYLSVRYEGGTHSITGVAEPDLILTDDRSLIGASNTGANGTVAYMGLKSVLLQWHKDDPVDAYEYRHNEAVYSFQGNRNPFVDHPEYIDCVFENNCSSGGDTVPPAMPSDFMATGGSGLVELTWNANTEQDMAGYNVYRSDSAGGSYVKLNSSIVTTSAYSDNSVAANTTYFYVITAVDSSNNESAQSSEAFATTDSGSAETVLWINEFHYDNASTDVGESVEVAGSAGLNLSGWTIVAYNGKDGSAYKTVNLSGVITDQQAGFGTLSFAASGLQNGAPDGLALVDNSGKLVQFISYEGSFTAADGAAAGVTSVDVGVSETSSTPSGHSLQLSGSGTSYAEFSWQAAAANTSGQLNNGQVFASSVPVNKAPSASLTESCNNLSCTFDAAASSDSDGTITSYSWSFGDGGNAAGVNPSYSYSADGSYTVTLTVTDNDGASASTSTTVTVENVVSVPWINEFHYDNASTDVNEFIEIAGSAGTDLSGWKIEAYNGGNGTVYKTFDLSGVIANQSNGFGTIAFDTASLQNGGPDGFALVDDSGTVVQFLSYEGSMTAADGSAAGTASTDVGVAETSSTQSGYSLQLSGTGSEYSAFSWQAPAAATKGALNQNQSF
ncbi:endonuclease [Psychromonas aquimarina]|uniref:endonuclease n=1 Tax=Psychromonas aquimarina TaxID=444919 RepID=UPI0003F83F8A|nr:endonuclease [Psychromonas aquimarina]